MDGHNITSSNTNNKSFNATKDFYSHHTIPLIHSPHIDKSTKRIITNPNNISNLFTFGFVYCEQLRLQINGSLYHASLGDVILLNPNLEIYYIDDNIDQFTDSFFSTILNHYTYLSLIFLPPNTTPSINKPIISNPSLVGYFHNLQQSYNNHRFTSDSYLNRIIEIVNSIVDMYFNYSLTVNSKPNEPIKFARQHIDQFFLEKITLDELSNTSKLSKYHLSRSFKIFYGITISQYISYRRLEYSRTLLRSSMPIIDVAVESGFYDQSHFSNVFSKFYHMTPKQYKSTYIDKYAHYF